MSKAKWINFLLLLLLLSSLVASTNNDDNDNDETRYEKRKQIFPVSVFYRINSWNLFCCCYWCFQLNFTLKNNNQFQCNIFKCAGKKHKKNTKKTRKSNSRKSVVFFWLLFIITFLLIFFTIINVFFLSTTTTRWPRLFLLLFPILEILYIHI